MKKTDYLTDIDLMQLIESVENNDLILAPDYLKDTILKKSALKRPVRQHELLFFSAKIITAAAASIALLFALPDFGQIEHYEQRLSIRQEVAGSIEGDSVLRKFNQTANHFCSLLSDGTNYIFRKENYVNDK